MQRAEMEELRHREANNTALQAIGPRKKPRLDSDAATTVVSLTLFCCKNNFIDFYFIL